MAPGQGRRGSEEAGRGEDAAGEPATRAAQDRAEHAAGFPPVRGPSVHGPVDFCWDWRREFTKRNVGLCAVLHGADESTEPAAALPTTPTTTVFAAFCSASPTVSGSAILCTPTSTAAARSPSRQSLNSSQPIRRASNSTVSGPRVTFAAFVWTRSPVAPAREPCGHSGLIRRASIAYQHGGDAYPAPSRQHRCSAVFRRPSRPSSTASGSGEAGNTTAAVVAIDLLPPLGPSRPIATQHALGEKPE